MVFFLLYEFVFVCFLLVEGGDGCFDVFGFFLGRVGWEVWVIV